MNWKPWLARAAALLILAGAAEPFYFRFFGSFRRQFGAIATTLPYRKTPGLQRFMTAVRERTRDGDRIAIAVPMQRWDGGYAYAFTRSTYLLAGRTTVPLVDPADRPTPANIARANWIAAWHTAPSVAGFEAVWRDPDGVLLRKVR